MLLRLKAIFKMTTPKFWGLVKPLLALLAASSVSC